jgi:hypothetical protein
MTPQIELELTSCPECGRPAEIVQRVTFPSTDGPVEHVKTRCITGPWFLVPAADLAPAAAVPADPRERLRRSTATRAR